MSLVAAKKVILHSCSERVMLQLCSCCDPRVFVRRKGAVVLEASERIDTIYESLWCLSFSMFSVLHSTVKAVSSTGYKKRSLDIDSM